MQHNSIWICLSSYMHLTRHFFILLSIILSYIIPARATHLAGGEISYKYIDSNRYLVYATLYRDCRGVALKNMDSMASVRCISGSGKTILLSMKLQSISDISVFCDTVSSPCNPANTYGTGNGTEKHVYADTLDFSDTLYSSLKSCGAIIFEISDCCRSGAITTGAANTKFYNYARLDLQNAPQNSSPVIFNDPLRNLCCNQPFYYSMDVRDTIDGDSISYAFGYPLSSISQQINYLSSFTYKTPFTYYDPFKNGQLYPHAWPPIGLYLDPVTGDLIFTPTSCTEVTTMVIEISEWRKDSTGTPVKIGVIRRDMTYWVTNCQGNAPPILNGPYSYSICEGNNLSFTITSDDKIFVPPPPATTPPPDTLQLSWKHLMNGASLKIVDTTAIKPSARFNWTPSSGTASDNPYAFTLYANDNNCPRPGVSSRVYQIRVKEIPNGVIERTDSVCGVYHYNVTDLNPGINTFRWEVLDSDGQIVFDPSIAHFSSKGSYLSTSQNDRLVVRANGTYIVRLTVRNGLNCTSTRYDTLNLLRSHYDLFSKMDTVYCDVSSVRLEPDLIDTSKFTHFIWNGLRNDSMAHLNVQLTDTLVPYWLSAYSKSDGCFHVDTVRIARAYTARLNPLSDIILCKPFSHSVTTQLKDTFYYYPPVMRWENGDTSLTRTFKNQGKYLFTATNKCGADTARINVFEITKPHLVSISNDTLCLPFSDTVKLVDLSDSGRSVRTYTWENGFKGKQRVLDKEGVFQIVAQNKCGSDTTGFTRTGIPVPALQAINNDTLCIPFSDTIKLVDLSDSGRSVRTYTWENGFKGKQRVLDKEGDYQVVAQNICGSDTITFNRTGALIPVLIDISSDTFCPPFKDTLQLIDLADSGKVSITYSWENGNSGSLRVLSDTGNYFGVATNICGSDTVHFRRYTFIVPAPDLGPDTSIDKPFSLTLDAGPVGKKYKWSNGDTTRTSTVTDWGKYFVDISDTCGNYSDTILVGYCNAGFYYQKDTSATFGILLVDTSSGPNLDYVWDFGDGDTSHSKTPSHTYATFGKYLLCLNVSNQFCSSTFCDSLGMDSTGKLLKEGAFGIVIIDRSSLGIESMQEKGEATFRIYPVPNDGSFTIDLRGMNSNHVDEIIVYDYLGKQQKIMFEKTASDRINVEMADPAKGMYFLVTVSNGVRSQPRPLFVR